MQVEKRAHSYIQNNHAIERQTSKRFISYTKTCRHANDFLEPVKWPDALVSPIVPVLKPGRPNEIALTQEKQTKQFWDQDTMPTVDDLLVRLNGAKFFWKLDLKACYTQLLLDEESRYITVFCTNKWIFQYKRLNFGINEASEIIQKAIEQVHTLRSRRQFLWNIENK